MRIEHGRLLFVYGTLRRDLGLPAYHLLERHADFYDYGTMRGRLFDLGSYPGVVASIDASDRVRGELFLLRVPGRALAVLDEFEGIPEGRADWAARYVRESLAINSRRHGRLRAWVYLYRFATAGLAAIPAGDYVRYRRGLSGEAAPAAPA